MENSAPLEILKQRRQRLLQGLADATKARDEADSKMQSRYDTQKEDAAQDVAIYQGLLTEVTGLIEELEQLDPNLNREAIGIGSRITLEFDDGSREEFLLLDRSGGTDLGEFQVLSCGSPVGKAVIGYCQGDTVDVSLPRAEISVHILKVS